VATIADQPLLERDEEVAQLQALLDAARAGQGRFVAIEGPAGIGKSHLLADLRKRAADDGMIVLGARGAEFERGFSYGIVRQLFEPALMRAGTEAQEELLTGAAGLTRPLFEGADLPVGSNGDASYATLHGLHWLTVNLSARAPLLLVVDDIRWSDAPSLRYLAYLVRRLEGLPALVVCAQRPADPPSPDETLIAELLHDPLTTLIHPRLLTMEAARAIVNHGAEDEFVAACHEASGGNPLLLRALAAEIASEGIEPVRANADRVRALGPGAVGGLVQLRLSRLPDEAGRLARAVSLLGDGAELRHAAELAGLDDASAGEAAEALARTEIIRLDSSLGFIHPLVAAAVSSEIAPLEREQGHVAAARILRAAGADPERIAAHLLIVPPSGDAEAVGVLRDAAARALRQATPGEAASYLRRALEEPPADEERTMVLVELGEAELMVQGPLAVGHLREAHARLTDPIARARVAALLGRGLFFTGRIADAVQLFFDAIDEAPPDAVDLRDRMLGGILIEAINDPDLHAGIGVPHFERLRGEDLERGVGGRTLLSVLAFEDARSGRADAASSADRAVRALANRELYTANAAYAAAVVTLALADREEAVWACDEIAADATSRGSVVQRASGQTWRALAMLGRGSPAEAEADAREAIDASRQLGFTVVLPYAVAFRADALIDMGRTADAATALDTLGRGIETVPNGHFLWPGAARARLLIARRHFHEALIQIDAVRLCFERLGGVNPAVLPWRSMRAEALTALERGDEGAALAAEEVELARAWGAPLALGRALRIQALAAGDERALRESVEVLDGSSARLELARSLVDLGAMLRRTNRRAESRDPLRRGLELAHLCGTGPLEERAREELAATGARPRSVILSGYDALTPSERRVSRMAADGLINRDIAQTLFVTPKTVEVHLSNSYRKLGISSRTELAAAIATAPG
jgi:DNA-binding CsgD family transcriptional regulator